MTARYLAAEALMRTEQGGFSGLVLDSELRRHPLEPRDRAFAAAVFYAALEHQGTIDYILSRFVKGPLTKLDAPVRAVLRTGLAQLRWLQVPPSAAVNEAVKLTKAFGKTSAAGMVNAVLRRAAGYDLSSAVFADAQERLMALGSAGPEVAAHFLRCYPEEALAILCAPAVKGTELRVNPLRIAPQALCERLRREGAENVRPGAWENCLLADFAASPADTPAFRAGLYHVEGRPSQLAALAVGARPGDTVIDLCAAPGGKTLTIAEQMQNRGRLFSCDAAPRRVALIEQALQRTGITCAAALCSDASRENSLLPPADRVLADVPCSGLGVLGKKPDIRYKSLAGLAELTALQAQILKNAAKCLKKGGRLVYSTCTLNPAENEEQVRAFLQQMPEFCVVPFEFMQPGMRQSDFGVLSLPPETGMDGFFISTMEKR